MRSIDTHAHLDFPEFEIDRRALIEELKREGIAVINPASSLASNEAVDKLTRQFSNVWGAVGLHPIDVGEIALEKVPSLIDSWQRFLENNNKLVAVGEIGLDFYGERCQSANAQKAALRQFLTFALERQLPVIFHCRDAYGDLITILETYRGIKGVVHCFSGSTEEAECFLKLGLHVSFTANLTYPKNKSLRQVSLAVPLERLLLETDAPFLAPQSRRGQRNDPYTIFELAELHAQLRHLSAEEVIKATAENAKNLFFR